MKDLLYDKDCTCSVCTYEFTTKKVRTRPLRIEKREDDFNIIYKSINPNYYYIWVCPVCGYAATEREFDNIRRDQIKTVKKMVSYKWKERDFGGVRTFQEAEESFKMALLIAQILEKTRAYTGGVCLRLAWLYREIKDPREQEFLAHALRHFEKAYQTERIDEAGLDEVTLAYLNGELNRRLGHYENAIRWYGTTLEHPNIKRKRQIQIKAREQWGIAREQYTGNKEVK
ncbi:MAG TPA: DUF2225 domain-containing protein [Oscillospiraceae bacterium]|nr:DUF2225 domain-containing protein [Oscillospiraceae bacterium]